MANKLSSYSAREYEHDTNTVERIDLARIFSILRKKIWWVVTPAILFFALSGLFAFNLENYYISEVQILVDPEGSRFVEGELPASNRATNAHATNQLYILTSVKVLLQVVESENLADDPEFGAAKPYLTDRNQRVQRALRNLQKAVVADLNKASFVINLSVTSSDPAKSARIANDIANTYIETRSQMTTEVLRRATNDLSSQLASLEKKVQDGDRAVQDYKAKNGLIDVNGRPPIDQKLTETNTEISRISASIAKTAALASEVAKARSDKEYLRFMSDTDLTPTILELRTRYHEALQQQAVLEATLGKNHPLLVAARTNTQSALTILNEQLQNFAGSLTRNVQTLKKQRALLQQNLADLEADVNADDRSMVRLRELERTLESDRLVYEAFLLRTRQIAGQERTTSENPQIISTAQVPLNKAGPKRLLIVAGATMFGLIIGIGLALALGQDNKDGVRHSSSTLADFRGVVPLQGRYSDIVRCFAKEAAGRKNYCVVIYSRPDRDQSHRAVFDLACVAARSGKDVLLVDASLRAALTVEAAAEKHKGLLNSIVSRRIEGNFVDYPATPGLWLMPAGYKTPRISTQINRGKKGLIDLLNAGNYYFDMVMVYAGNVDECRLYPDLERAADKFGVLALNANDRVVKEARGSGSSTIRKLSGNRKYERPRLTGPM